MVDGEKEKLEITAQKKLETTCPNCDSERIFFYPKDRVPETNPWRNLAGEIYICTGCSRVFHVLKWSYHMNDVLHWCYKFEHIGDTVPDRTGGD